MALNAEPRLSSIDAYRGFVMLLMMGEVLEFGRLHMLLPHSRLWEFLAHHQDHVAWVGCSLHDLIQPSFSFLVGVSLPFSLARRSREGQPQWHRTIHAFWRALVLVLLGIFLRSTRATQTNWIFTDTLSQIGLGFGLLYLLALCSRPMQWLALGVILVGYWLAFAVYPLPGPGFDWKRAGVSPDAPQVLHGFAGHWSMNTNIAWRFDTWFLNRFPRETPFKNSNGGYATLSFIPTFGTMILGLLAGGVLRSAQSSSRKIAWLVTAGAIGLAAGWLLGAAGICPVVKRIWTPSWVLFSGGWCFLLLAAFYGILDVARWRGWAYVLIVVGMNSIAAYLIAHLFQHFIAAALPRHFGRRWITAAGPNYEHLILGAGVLGIEWMLLWGMRRRKIYLRV